MSEEKSIKLKPLRWPHIVGIVLIALGFAQLFSRHSREGLLYYSIAAGLGYGFCRPRGLARLVRPTSEVLDVWQFW